MLRRLYSVVRVTSLEAKVIATYSGPWIISETSIAIGDLGRVPPGKYEVTLEKEEIAIVQPDYVSRFYNRKHHTVHFFLTLQTNALLQWALLLE